MSYVLDIKNAIKKLDAGSFQNLCDDFLSEMGYANIVSLGSQPGTNKTTSGTPDTYYCVDENDRYFFIEYTTQQSSIYKKILSDIEKCLDEDYTKIKHDKIAEILYFHTTSNLLPKQDLHLKELCSSKGILLKIYGIDYLANELYENHKYLVKQHLDISIATQQILSYDDFVRSYNNAKTAAPIDTDFKFRTEEMNNVFDCLNNNLTVILCGDAGIGKTRLALECCRKYSEENNYRIFCIRNNNQPIFDDLHLFFRKSDNYIILIDDANELSELETIIRYFNEKTDSDFKIIITVRSYAIENVQTIIKSFNEIKLQKIVPLRDEEIEELLKNEFGIQNHIFLDKIIKIAEGNARIAFLAGKISADTNSLEAIEDVTDIYSAYYGKFLLDLKLTEKNMLSSAAILAFVGAIHLDRIDIITDVLTVSNMTIEEFKESIYQLHSYEIVDIYKDKAVKFNDQCLSNYLLYYVFVKNKWLKLSEIIRYAFNLNKQLTISAINVLSNLFITPDNQNYLLAEIKDLWKKLSTEDPLFFWEYVKVFYKANPKEALMLIKNKIDETTEVDLETEDLKLDMHCNSVNDELLIILGGFANTTDLEIALELYFAYFKKRPDLYNQFYYTVVNNYGIDKDCYEYTFYTPTKFIEKIIDILIKTKNRNVIRLFIDVTKYYLKTHFDGTESKRGNTFSFYSFDLLCHTTVVDYRIKIWDTLIYLYSQNIETDSIEDVLYDFGHHFNEKSADILIQDYQYILKMLALFTNKNSYYFCTIINKFVKLYNRADANFDEYTNSKSYTIYKLFNRIDGYSGLSWDEKDILFKKKISEFVSKLSKSEFFSIIDFLSDTKGSENEYNINSALNYAFESVFNNSNYYIEALHYIFNKSNKQILSSFDQMKLMFSKYSDKKIWSIISVLPDYCKNTWQYCYFNLLPAQYIDKEHLQAWYLFLKDDSDSFLLSSSYRDLLFLKKFQAIDEKVIIESCRIIMEKHSYSEFMVKCYLSLLFNPNNKANEVIEIFNGEYELLCQLYLMNLSLQHNEDYRGVFLKEIYIKYPSIIDLLFNQYFDNQSYLKNEDMSRLIKLFELDNYMFIFDDIMDRFLRYRKKHYFFEGDVVSSIISNKYLNEQYSNRPDEWVKHYISTYSKDKNRVSLLFKGISKIQDEKKKEYLQLFLSYNKDVETFRELQLFSSFESWSGSEVPVIQKKINYLSGLLSILVGLDYLEHSIYIENKIESYKEYMEEVEINEILRGF